ncbi:hypothetical protein HF086_005648 [Spodoptera exigua]|uniref:Uncharacterized protein n=1 Tax=Spodoptera exigua TaxID=7107 RepID=A0A922MY52_SPOEX|nr:hypothetical protein HF086_005648 [Spodoptera exigua]
MLIEIPELRRCCCCLPLRRGILIFGYISLKRRRLLRIYYYYELTTMVATFVVVLITYIDFDRYPRWNFILTEFCLAFTGFVLQVYLVLLVRSELKKDRYQEGTSSYINHVAEVFIDPPLRRQWRTDL